MGGGAVGVELAGEIATDFPGKNVTLVHAHKKGLIDGKRFTEKFRKEVYGQLVKLKVDVLLGMYFANVGRSCSTHNLVLRRERGSE